MNIEKLKKQKAEIEAAIKAAENAEKLRPKFEKICKEILEKHPNVLTRDPADFKKSLDDFLARFAGQHANQQQ